MKTAALVFLAGTVVSHAAGQTVVESSAATGAASAAASGAKGVGKSTAGVFDKLNKVLGEKPAGGDKAGGPAAKVVTLPAPASGAPEPPRIIDASKVKVGMARAALLKELGKPLVKTSGMDGASLLETYYYQGTDDMVVITLREGKVKAVTPSAEPKSADKPPSS